MAHEMLIDTWAYANAKGDHYYICDRQSEDTAAIAAALRAADRYARDAEWDAAIEAAADLFLRNIFATANEAEEAIRALKRLK